MNRFHQGAVALLLIGTLLSLVGCQSGVQTSSEYQKLPKGEGENRMSDTLKRRAASRAGNMPPTPGYSNGSAPAGK